LANGTSNTGSPVDLGYLAFSAFGGAAALTPSMAGVASIGYARHQLGLSRLIFWRSRFWSGRLCCWHRQPPVT
jgi:hypothetical protein